MQKGIRLTTLWLKYMSIPMRPSELKLYVRVHILKNVCVCTNIHMMCACKYFHCAYVYVHRCRCIHAYFQMFFVPNI